MATDEDPMAIEIAVTPEGKVSINIQHLPTGKDGWGHLTFDIPQAIDFHIALQHAIEAAHQIGQTLAMREKKPILN